MSESDKLKVYDCDKCETYMPVRRCYEHNPDTGLCVHTPENLDTWYTKAIAHEKEHLDKLGQLEEMLRELK